MKLRAAWLLVFIACRRPDAPVHLDAAKAALFEHKPDLALVEFKQALDLLERDDGAQAAVYRARALRGAADVYAFQLSDPKRAVEVYRELIRRCPEAPETLEGRLHLANLLRRTFHDTRSAIAELTQAIARNPPQSAELSYQVATMYFEIQDYRQSELEASNVARKYETSAYVDDALFLRGQALAMIEGHNAEAQRAFMDLVDRFPDSPLRSYALVDLGRLRADLGELERAIEVWVEALKTYPEPNVVQGSIDRARAQLRATTPRSVGDASKAFDWNVPGNMVIEKQPGEPKARTSAEAVGGTKQEAESEVNMKEEVVPTPKEDKIPE